MAPAQPWSFTQVSQSPIDTPPETKNCAALPHIFVRDPPREQLPAEPGSFCDNTTAFLVPFPGQYLNATPATDLYITDSGQPKSLIEEASPGSKPPRRQRVIMAKKRRSLQSIFIPSLRPAPISPIDSAISSDPSIPSTTRSRSHSVASRSRDYFSALNGLHSPTSDASRITSSRDSPPPDFLLDDDPFANLSAVPAFPAQDSTPTSTPTPLPTLSPVPPSPLETLPAKPRSPLTPPDRKSSNIIHKSPVNRLATPGVSRTLSGRARPAYKKPAFTPRPSLPSLDTLARMNIVLTKKVRRGRVGAGLPFEPWDQVDNDQTSEDSSASQSESSSLLDSPVSGPAPSPDFVSGLELDFLDISEDETFAFEASGSSTFSSILHTSPVSQDDYLYNTDSELSLDEASIPSSSRTSYETTSLSRSTSMTSDSSVNSIGECQWPSFSHSNASMSSIDDSDVLHSPPDDFFNFPASGFDTHEIVSAYWSSEDLYASLSGPTLSPALDADTAIPDMMHEPGTSTGTIRPSKVLRRSPSPVLSYLMDESEAVDGTGGEYQHQGSLGRGWEYGSGGNSQTSGNNAGYNGQTSNSGVNRLRGRGDDEDEDDKRDRVNRSFFSTPSDSDASTSDEADEDSTDDYGEPHHPSPRVPEGLSASSDDDIPLAQRIPTALKAQSTIRREVRDEREKRRTARAARAEASASARVQPAPRLPGAGGSVLPAPMSSSQEAALHASRSVHRPRTRTLPASEMQPFSPDDLARKLKTVEVTTTPASTHHRSKSTSTSRRDREGFASSRPGSAGRGSKDPSTFQPFTSPPQSPPAADFRPLRPMRSFRRSEGKKLEEHHVVPLPVDAGQKLARSLTRKDEASGSSPSLYPTRVSQDESSSKQSLARKSGEEPRKLIKVHPEARSARSSSEMERQARPSLQRPPVPPLPLPESLGSPHNARGPVTQQRIFIGDMQRFNMVEITSLTNAGDVLEMVEAQGTLKGWVGSGGWMLWEVAQDFGMERPIRSFELLSDVQASWNKDKMMNTFVIKMTPLAGLLSRSTMPSASPTYAGYVEWESKRGKWNKRWLQLREHSLWLSKRDNGRDEVLLCSLSNFDAYFITRLHKSPRQFSFAVKSTDSLSFFENTADYLHIFSCSDKEGNTWMERILLARSYVLHQERHVLFSPKAVNGNAAGGPGALVRSGTRHQPSSRPIQPLLSVTAPMAITQQKRSDDVFEPGSLLRKHT